MSSGAAWQRDNVLWGSCTGVTWGSLAAGQCLMGQLDRCHMGQPGSGTSVFWGSWQREKRLMGQLAVGQVSSGAAWQWDRCLDKCILGQVGSGTSVTWGGLASGQVPSGAVLQRDKCLNAISKQQQYPEQKGRFSASQTRGSHQGETKFRTSLTSQTLIRRSGLHAIDTSC